MNLADLKKSISEMPTGELTKLLTDLRISRRTTKAKPKKDKPDDSAFILESLDSMIGKLSEKDRQRLLELIEE